MATNRKSVATNDGDVATKNALIKFRVATNERDAMEAAAAKSGKSLSEWARDSLLAVIRGPEIVAQNDRSSAAVAKDRLQRDASRRQAFQPGVADPEKLAAFQERSGMTKWGKKRGQG